MKLSVVIPVYRVEATLDRCVRSVVGQRVDGLEVILVDDGSDDGCPRLCDEWARRDSRITVVHKPNGGLSDARNAGMAAAHGELLTFVDADDYLDPGTLPGVLDVMADCDIVEYPFVHGTLHPFRPRVYTDAGDYWLTEAAYRHSFACNKIFRRRLFDDVAFPVGRVFEDAYTLPRLLRKARRVGVTDQGLYHYTLNADGITANATGADLRMLLDAHLEGGMPMNDDYYLYLLNIQMDVYELTGDSPRLPGRRLTETHGTKQALKAMMLNTFGINTLCKINKAIHKVGRW